MFNDEGRIIKKVARQGITENEINTFAYDPSLGIFAADIWNNQVIHFNENLEVLTFIKRPGKRLGQFGGVPGVAVSKGLLYFADFENNKILVLQSA